MNGSFFRKLAVMGTESLVSLVLVAVFFLGFLGVIGFAFPRATSLESLMTSTAIDGREEPGWHGIDLQLNREDSLREPVAWLAQTRRDVRGKPPSAIAWASAKSGTALANHHSIQTYARSTAMINFDTGGQLTLDENSLIVVRGKRKRRLQRQMPASVVVLGGTLTGSTDEAAEGVPLEVVTATGASLVVANDGTKSNFKVSMNPDATSTFSVLDGTAEVLSGGRTVTVSANQAVTVAAGEAPGEPVKLPSAPELLSPARSTRMAFRETPPPVRFEWDPRDNADAYRLKISRDADFEEIVYDQKTTATEVVHENLNEGRFYWRVSSVRNYVEGPETSARAVELTKDEQPPRLTVDFPVGTIREESLLLTGLSEPGAEVFVADRSTSATEAGDFTIAVRLEPGVNVVVVEAMDGAGNVAYESKLLNARF